MAGRIGMGEEAGREGGHTEARQSDRQTDGIDGRIDGWMDGYPWKEWNRRRRKAGSRILINSIDPYSFAYVNRGAGV